VQLKSCGDHDHTVGFNYVNKQATAQGVGTDGWPLVNSDNEILISFTETNSSSNVIDFL
jgi:hypothetical protein